MKKILTLVLAALFCASMLADTAILSWYLGENGTEATAANSITGATGSAAEGWTIAMTGNLDKNWAGTSSKISYNGTAYKTLKNSNGVQNTVTLPEGLYASKVVFYAVTNNTETVGFLKEFDGKTAKDTVFSLTDYDNPTIITKELDIPKNEFTFNFGGRQVCFIAIVTYSDQVPEVPEPPTPHGLLSWYLGENGAEATAANSITGATGSAAEGWTIAITGNLDKNWGAGGKISYNGTIYKTLKNSNGAQNTVTLPDGLYASKVVFYAITNDAETVGALKEFDGKTAKDTVFSLMDYDNPTIITKELEIPKNEFTFTFGGRQVCFLAAITFSDEAPVIDSGTCGENLTWNLSYDSVLTISGTGAMADYESYTATLWYSNRESIKSIVIKEGVTCIGEYAFSECNSLTAITIPNSVVLIKGAAFYGCSSLNAVNIYDLAAWCKINFSASTSNPLYYAKNLYLNGTLVEELVIPDGITKINDYSFYNCSSLTSVTIPNSVTSIGKSAFSGCKGLTSVNIPNSVTTIESSAFSGCSSLNAVNISDLAAWCNISFSAASSNPLYYAKNLYLNGTLVKDLVIPNGVTKINDYIFYNCGSLTSVTIPNSVTSIGTYSFYGCNVLASITIPNGVTSIGEYAFYGCSVLASITIPNGVTSIGEYAFNRCSNLTAVYISDLAAWCNIKFSTSTSNPLYYAKNLYLNGTLVEELVIPDGITKINDYAFYNCGSLTSVTIPNSVTSIGKSAFEKCSGLTSVNIPNSVTTIGSSAFYGCSSLNAVNIYDLAAWCNISFKASSSNPLYYAKNLYLNGTLVKDLVIPNGVTKINDYIFYNCGSLTSVTIPNSVTSIGNSAFYGCSSLTSVAIPNSVTSIGNSAFYKCSGLASITIPNSVTSIGSSAFIGCSGLTSITNLATTPQAVTSYVFGTPASNTAVDYSACTLYVPAESVEAYKAAEVWKEFTNILPIGESSDSCVIASGTCGAEGDNLTWELSCDSVLTISGTGAMDDYYSYESIPWYEYIYTANSIKSVIIQEGVTHIGQYAFRNCHLLASVSLANSLTSIGGGAFSYCGKLPYVKIPSSVTNLGIGVFEGCPSMSAFEVSEANPNFCSVDGVLFDKNISTLMQYPPSKTNTTYSIPSNVVTIAETAFWCSRNLTIVTIPNGVASIGSSAFLGCSGLTSVTIPNSVATIGQMPFVSCTNLPSIDVDPSNPYFCSIDGVLFNKDKTNLIEYPIGKAGTSYVIPDGVIVLGNGAFEDCTSLISVTIPSSVESIGDFCFAYCRNLRSVTNYATLPQNIIGAGLSADTLYVPKESIEAYQKADVWKEFGTIKAIEETPAPCLIASGTCGAGGDNLTWTLSCDSVLTISGTGAMENYKFDTIPLTPWNAYLPVIKSIVIADGVTRIGSWAFGYCSNCTSIDIPNSVTSIEKRAFSSSGLNSLNIPNSVTNIGDEVFVYCPNLTSIEVAKDNSYYSSIDGVLFNKDLTTLIYYPAGKRGAYVIPNSVISIGKYAFNNCIGLTSIEIPNSTTTIGDRAFFYCTGLSSVKMKNSVTSIGTYAFLHCINLTSITLSNSIKSIGNYAFQSCSGLTSVTIPNSVTYIGIGTFNGCSNLTEITIPDSVTTIEEDAFYDCINISSFTIPYNVTNIERYAFGSCSGIKSITNYAIEPQTINADVFTNVNLSSVTLYVPAESIEAYQNADVWNEFGTIKAIGEEPTPCLIASGTCGENLTWELSCDSVLTISGTGEMENYTNTAHAPWYDYRLAIKSLIIGDNVTSIGKFAFYYCSGLTSVTMSNSVTSIEDYAFAYCRSLTTIEIPSSVTSIGDGVFYSCESLTSVTIPNRVTSIGEVAFMNCVDLTSIVIPNSVTNIEDGAFAFCYHLTSIIVAEDNQYYSSSDGVLFNKDMTTLIQCPGGKQGEYVIPTSVISIEDGAFQKCQYLTSIEVPSSVTSMGYHALSECIALNSIVVAEDNQYFSSLDGVLFNKDMTTLLQYPIGNTSPSYIIPTNVTNIAFGAFLDSRKLKSVTIPNSVASIGNNSFLNCSKLTSLTNYATTPQNINSTVFGSNVNLSALTLYVPAESIEAYQDADIWKEFGTIKAIEETPAPCLIASGTCGENLTWELSCDSVLTISGTGAMTDYTSDDITPWFEYRYRSSIKSIIINDGVTNIGNHAFSKCENLTSVEMPNSIKGIGERAFQYCDKLTSIEIPNSVTSIGFYAFGSCTGLTSITIPTSVTNIGNLAFSYCIGITSIIVENNNAIYDSRNNCNAIIETATNTLIYGCRNTIIPESITHIGERAFFYCSTLTAITIPNNITSIEEKAFAYCTGLKEVTNYAIEPQAINSETFSNINLSALTLYVPAESLDAYQKADVWNEFGTIKAIEETPAPCLIASGTCGENLTWELSCDSVLTISGTGEMPACTLSNPAPWYKYEASIQSVVVSDGVTSIGQQAFYNCTALTSVTMGNSVDSIGYAAFADCSKLSSVAIGNSVKKIGEFAFYRCTSLSSIEIPNSVEIIDYFAFYECSGLVSVTMGNSVTSIGGMAFGNCSGLTSIEIPNSVTSILDNAFENCSNLPVIDNIRYADTYLVEAVDKTLSTYSIKKGTRWIGDYAFEQCPNLTSIEIPNSVIVIGNVAFNETGLTSVTIPNNVISIGQSAFAECTKLSSVTMGSSLTSILYNAFWNCTNLTSIEIPNSVTDIGDHAFASSGLTSVTIPNSVISIGGSAFSGCRSLTAINVAADNQHYSSADGVLFNKEKTILIQYPEGKSATSYTVPNSVTSIENGAFWRCVSLAAINVAADNQNYSSIDGVLFNKEKTILVQYPINKSATFYSIPGSVTSIANFAFSHCSGLTSIEIPNSVTTIGTQAFSYCSGLTSVTIPGSVASIGGMAFFGCTGLASITCEAINPPIIDASYYVYMATVPAFPDFCYSIPLYVPANSVSAYKGADEWKEFSTIKAIGEEKDYITIAEAVHIGMALDSMATSTGTYTIEGYVINADAFSSKYKYQNWYMTDDPKSASSDFQAYQCYPVDNADTIAVFNGSKVRMTGQLHKYYNKATSTYIIEMKRVSATILALPETDTITVAEALAIGEKLVIEESSGVPYTIRGYVSYIETPFDEQYKNQSFYIADDISSVAYSAQTGGFHVYRGKPADGMPIKEGAFVELTATIKKYSDAKIENAEQNVRITILKEAPECRNLAGVCGDNLTWTLSTCDSALAISGTGAMYNYSKGEAPWSRFGVTSVNLGKGLTAIGKYDLYACYMPSIIIPASVTSIAASAFSRCPALTDIFVEARNSQYSSIDGVLYSKDKKTILAHPIGRKGAYEIPDGVDTIGVAAFNACRDITSITLPNSATTIKEAAFFGCGISSMTIPASVDSIERIAFVGCMNLTTIVNHAVVPQKIDSTVFEGVNLSACALYVPAESVKDYQTANVWKDFGSIIPMQAEEVTEPITDVETQPQDNSVIVTWPVVASADTYTLEIKKNGELICTLTFSADGRLMGIAFAPARNGGNHAPAAIKTANGGLRFTVTGLNSGTLYDLDVIAKDDMNQTIKTYQKSFTTTGVATAIDNIDSSSLQGGDRGRLIYRNGQILILRGDRTYTLTGQEVK